MPAEALQEFAARVAATLESGAVVDKEALHTLKRRLARELGTGQVPTDADVLACLEPDAARKWGPILRKKPVRSLSGVAVVAVMSSPAACPHGKCIYCPGGPDVGVPQSYTGHEPSTLRAARLDYDPYRVVRTRLGVLERNGHAVDKVELVVQGGTFPARDEAYQDWSVAMLYAACNDGPAAADPGPLETEAEWRLMDEVERHRRLKSLQEANESARCRVVGLTVETKPDWCLEPHVDAMLRHGTTRVELGIQCLDEEVLRLTHRGHTLQDARDAMRITRDAGLKVCVHMMPGLPRRKARQAAARAARQGGPTPGLPRRQTRRSVPRTVREDGPPPPLPMAGQEPVVWETDPEADVEDFRRLFAEEDWRPDMLKIYPTLVVSDGETVLKRWWREGRYTPYSTEEAAAVVAQAKHFVPEYCRIQRIDRDIPTTRVAAGVMNSNLRQWAQREMVRRGLPPCRCIRCRESGQRERQGRPADPERVVLVRREHGASGGLEVFLSLEDPEADAVVAFLRLRRVGPHPHRAEYQAPGGSAVVRELRVYGTAVPLGADGGAGAWQHRGLGLRLLEEAERVSFGEWGVGRLLVIAAVGVKGYYRRHGYHDVGPYVAKDAAGGPGRRPSDHEHPEHLPPGALP